MKVFVSVVVILATIGNHFTGGISLPVSPQDTCTAGAVSNKIYEEVFVGGLMILYNISTQGANDKSCLYLLYDRRIDNGDFSNMTLLYNLDGTYFTSKAVVVLYPEGDRPLTDFYYDSGEYRKLSGEVTPDGVVVLVDCRKAGNDILIACKIAKCGPKLYSYAQAEAESILRSTDVSSAFVNQQGCTNAPSKRVF